MEGKIEFPFSAKITIVLNKDKNEVCTYRQIIRLIEWTDDEETDWSLVVHPYLEAINNANQSFNKLCGSARIQIL